MKITALLRKLTAIPGVSGREAVVSQPLLELLKEYCPDAALVQGNIIGTFGKRESGKPHVLLDAHFDQVGLIVTYIDENGLAIWAVWIYDCFQHKPLPFMERLTFQGLFVPCHRTCSLEMLT